MNEEKKLMTIGEVAKAMGITRRMIINYEDRGLIQADVRTSEGGYRYYTLDMMTRIRSIRIFQDMGLTLDEIRDYFDDSTDLTPMLTRLETLRDELNLNIEKLRERMNGHGNAEIKFVTLPRQTIHCRRLRTVTIEEKKDYLRSFSTIALHQYGSDTSKRMYFVEFPLADPNLISYCTSVPADSKGEYIETLPETQAICIYYHGAYEELPAVRERLITYAHDNHLALSGICRHIYLEGPPQHKDPKNFITQVALPIIG